MSTKTRPAPPSEATPGYVWVIKPDSGPLDWRVATPEESASRVCRRSQRDPCPNRPVAALVRGRRRVDYFYCAEHMYGRWIEDGQVMAWFLRKAAA